jgi:hypothetical protein
MTRPPMRRGASVPVPDRSVIEPDSPAADRLDGARAIATYWFGADTAETRKRIFKLAQDRTIPVAKVGGRLLASKRALSERYRQLTSGQAEAAD